MSSLPATKPRQHFRDPRRLSPTRNSGSFRAVAQYLSVFGAANRPEFRILDLLIPWIFVISVVWLSGGLAGGGDPGADRSVAAYLASSPFLPRLGRFAQ